MRTQLELAEDIRLFDLANKKDRTRLLHHVMHHWTVGEVFAYRDTCLPGGSRFDYQLMASPAFANGKTQSLIVIFSAMTRFCLLHAGALTVLRDDTSDSYLNMTPDQLGLLVPPEKRKLLERLDIAAKLDRLQETADGMKAQGNRIEGKVGEVGRIVVEKKAETEKRLAGQLNENNKLTRKLQLAEDEKKRLRGNDTK